jgi:hypothetical protein
VRLLERAAQSLNRDVGVPLRGRQIRVTEQLLNRPQISTTFEHVSGSAMAHRVGRNHRNTGRITDPSDNGAHHARIDA